MQQVRHQNRSAAGTFPVHSQMQFVEIAVQQYVNYVGLYKALGGGW